MAASTQMSTCYTGTPMQANRFFRAGVGTVIYNQAGQVAIFKRIHYPVGVWQFQQGGIDIGEQVEDTLWRELKEEVGLEQNDFTTITPYPHWTVHHEAESQADPSKPRLGQAHRWFYLALHPERTIDLSQATEPEASEWRWTTFEDAIEITESTKRPVYEGLYAHFCKLNLGHRMS